MFTDMDKMQAASATSVVPVAPALGGPVTAPALQTMASTNNVVMVPPLTPASMTAIATTAIPAATPSVQTTNTMPMLSAVAPAIQSPATIGNTAVAMPPKSKPAPGVGLAALILWCLRWSGSTHNYEYISIVHCLLNLNVIE